MSLLALDAIDHRFGGFRVLSDVTLQVREGSITGLIGPNGSGKTTLFNIVSGFVRPISGRVLYRGDDINKLSVTDRSRQGLVRTFQTPRVFASLSVVENVAAASYKGTTSGLFACLARTPHARGEYARSLERAAETCRRFGLGQVAHAPSSRLTAGQRRLLELARAYQGSPAALLLDEPSSGLNSREVAEMIEKLYLLQEEGVSLLVVSHDMDLMEMAEHVYVLSFGRIIAQGPLSLLRQNPAVREAYLGA